jgi:phenylalanyl-tRNA synthetase alpha chain
MKEQLEALCKSALEEIAAIGDLRLLEEARVRFLGRKGRITEILRGLSQVSAEERPALGQAANEAKETIAGALDARKAELEVRAEEQRTQSESVDISLPGRQPRQGHTHVIHQVTDEILDIFFELGF